MAEGCIQNTWTTLCGAIAQWQNKMECKISIFKVHNSRYVNIHRKQPIMKFCRNNETRIDSSKTSDYKMSLFLYEYGIRSILCGYVSLWNGKTSQYIFGAKRKCSNFYFYLENMGWLIISHWQWVIASNAYIVYII